MTFHSLSMKGFFFHSKTKIWVHQEHQFNFCCCGFQFLLEWNLSGEFIDLWPGHQDHSTGQSLWVNSHVVVAASCKLRCWDFRQIFWGPTPKWRKRDLLRPENWRIWRIWLWDPSLSMVGMVKWNMEIPPVVHFWPCPLTFQKGSQYTFSGKGRITWKDELHYPETFRHTSHLQKWCSAYSKCKVDFCQLSMDHIIISSMAHGGSSWKKVPLWVWLWYWWMALPASVSLKKLKRQ